MPAPIKLLIPFDSLVDAIAALDLEDQLRLRSILDQKIQNTEDSLDAFLQERGCQLPLKEGLPLTSSPAQSGQSNISIEHDRVVSQEWDEENL